MVHLLDNYVPIRVLTKVDGNRVRTLYQDGKWITITAGSSTRTISVCSDSLSDAMLNHLFACKALSHKDFLYDQEKYRDPSANFGE